MAIKKLCCLVFIIGILSPINAIDQECVEYQKNKIFECDDSNATIVLMFEYPVACPPNRMCNRNYIATPKPPPSGTTSGTKSTEVGGAENTEKICQACIQINDICGPGTIGEFKCSESSPTGFSQNGVDYVCPKGTVCNSDKKEGCQPCVKERCRQDQWTCDPADPKVVNAGGFEGRCRENYICNAEYLAPCNACIDPTEPVMSSTPSFRSTPQYDSTTEIIVTTSTTQLTEALPETTTDLIIITTPEGLENLTTTSTTRPTTTTKMPPFRIPNCNDGHGDTQPCRNGPPGAHYYYRCRYYSPVWFDYDIRMCSNIYSDRRCIGKVCNRF